MLLFLALLGQQNCLHCLLPFVVCLEPWLPYCCQCYTAEAATFWHRMTAVHQQTAPVQKMVARDYCCSQPRESTDRHCKTTEISAPRIFMMVVHLSSLHVKRTSLALKPSKNTECRTGCHNGLPATQAGRSLRQYISPHGPQG